MWSRVSAEGRRRALDLSEDRDLQHQQHQPTARQLAWLAESAPDVICLQELKAEELAFPLAEIEAAAYGTAWVGQKTWNGVAILARDADPVVTRIRLPGEAADTQSRYIEAAVNGVLIASIYLPNGNPNPGPSSTTSWLAGAPDRSRGGVARNRRAGRAGR